MTDLLRKSAYIHDRAGGVPTDKEIVYESLGGGRYIYWCSGGRGVAEAIKRHAEQTGNSAAAVMRTALTRQLTSEKSRKQAGVTSSEPDNDRSYNGNSVGDET